MLRILSLLLLAVLTFTSDLYAGAPKLTLVFNGNTEAEVRPCPS